MLYIMDLYVYCATLITLLSSLLQLIKSVCCILWIYVDSLRIIIPVLNDIIVSKDRIRQEINLLRKFIISYWQLRHQIQGLFIRRGIGIQENSFKLFEDLNRKIKWPKTITSLPKRGYPIGTVVIGIPSFIQKSVII